MSVVDAESVSGLLSWLAAQVHTCECFPFNRGDDIGGSTSAVVYAARQWHNKHEPLRLPSGAPTVVKQVVMEEQALYALVPKSPQPALQAVAATLPPPFCHAFAAAETTLHTDASSAAEARRDLQHRKKYKVAQPSWLWLPCRVQLPQFWCEAAIAALVNEFVLPHCPHFVASGKAAILSSSVTGAHIVQHVDGSLDSVLHLLTANQLKAVMFQFLVALHVGQTRIGLKHHDAHPRNVFLTLLDAGWAVRAPSRFKHMAPVHPNPLCASTTFAYKLRRPDGSVATLLVPHHGLMVKVGDWDQASACHPLWPTTRVMRADWQLLHVYDADAIHEWGPWSGDLVGHRGYDVQFLVGSLLAVHRGRLQPDVIAWLSLLQEQLGGLGAATSTGRPAHGKVSDVPPMDLLLNPTLFGEYVQQDGSVGAHPVLYTEVQV